MAPSFYLPSTSCDVWTRMSLCMHLLQVFLPTFILAVSFLCLMPILDSILAVSSQCCALPHWFQKVYSIRPGLPIPTLISPQTGLCRALLRFSHYFPTDPLSSEVRTFWCHNSPICKVSDYSSFSYSLRTSVLSLVLWGSWGYHLSCSSTVTMATLATPSVTYRDS